MADLSDVEAALVTLATQTLYPSGTSQPSALGPPCKIYRGWPAPASLDADLAAGVVNVSVFPTDVESRATRYLPRDTPLPRAEPSLTLTVAGNEISVSGDPSSPLNACAIVDGRAFVYPVRPGDTPDSIATGLAALINEAFPAVSGGPVVVIPNAVHVKARVGAFAPVVEEVRRQKRQFLISLWCNSPSQRDGAAKLLDSALAGIDFLPLPDGTAGRLLYERSRVLDSAEKARLYRRDLVYSVEYGTTRASSAAEVVAAIMNVSADPGGAESATIV